jgi:hypothetical protein
MTVKAAKKKAGTAIKDIIEAARRYIEAERALKESLRAEQHGGSSMRRSVAQVQDSTEVS